METAELERMIENVNYAMNRYKTASPPVKSTSSQSSIEYMYPKNVRRDQAAKVARGGRTRSCDRLRDYGVVCTKIVWPSYGKVLLSIHKKRILLESACEAHSGKRVNPIQLLGSCGAL